MIAWEACNHRLTRSRAIVASKFLLEKSAGDGKMAAPIVPGTSPLKQ